MNNQPHLDTSGDVTNLQPVTPKHFLTGQNTNIWPNALFSGTTASYRNLFRYQHSVLVLEWNYWMSKYLQSPQQRTKRVKEELIEPRTGELVWIVDKNEHPFNLQLGIIEKAHKSDDQRVRSALVRTASGSYKRPVLKLIVVKSERT